MNAKRLAGWVLCICVGALAELACASADSLSPIEISITRESHQSALLVSVRNCSQAGSLTAITLAVPGWGAGVPRIVVADTIVFEQALVVELPPNALGRDPTCAIVAYSFRGVQSHEVVRLERQANAASDWLKSTLPWGQGVIGVIVGAWAGYYFERRKTKHSEAAAWRREFFVRVEPAYREFLGAVENNLDVGLWNREFDRLKSNALVPSSVVSSFCGLQSLIASSTASVHDKQQACGDFRKKLEAYLWDFTK